MLQFVIKRIFRGALVLMGVVVALFLLFQTLPGDPVRSIGGPGSDAETEAAIRSDLGLDRPLTDQFIIYINDLSPISINETLDKDHPLHLDSVKYKPYYTLYSSAVDGIDEASPKNRNYR